MLYNVGLEFGQVTFSQVKLDSIRLDCDWLDPVEVYVVLGLIVVNYYTVWLR